MTSFARRINRIRQRKKSKNVQRKEKKKLKSFTIIVQPKQQPTPTKANGGLHKISVIVW